MGNKNDGISNVNTAGMMGQKNTYNSVNNNIVNNNGGMTNELNNNNNNFNKFTGPIDDNRQIEEAKEKLKNTIIILIMMEMKVKILILKV